MNQPKTLVPIVEGHSELASVPVFVRRILDAAGVHTVRVARPIRVHRTRVVRPGEMERACALARRTRECDAILVLLDADDDCPRDLGPALLRRARVGHSDIPIAVVVAKREFEAWFLGAVESLRGQRGIPAAAASLADPESIRDAKGRVGQLMGEARTYIEVDDQPALAASLSV